MGVAIVLLLIVIGSVVFHLLTPWWLTPLASNWKEMDHTLSITMAVTGAFFVVILLFVCWTLWRYTHRPGSPRAAYVPDNRKLEHWLIGITSVGIVALLAPGLKVYADYVQPPADAMQFEVLGQQWQWRYRFPGEGGKLGGSDARFFSATNPMAIDPSDPEAQDDIVVLGTELHLPVNKPVKVLARSHDVLHDYFVPQFRARMNIVPGQVSWFWFTPTVPGTYEAMCAQLCGVGHPNMHGKVVVEDEAAFKAWLATQPTFAATQRPADATPTGGTVDLVARGGALSQQKGCVACHSVDGAASVGPTWKGLFGKTETMADNSTALVDEAYLKAFIVDPKARAVKGFPDGVMPATPMTDAELDAVVAYIKTLK